MDQRFDKLEEKLDKIGNDISEIKIVQAEQAKDLKYHIKRTNQIEEKLVPLSEAKIKFDGAFRLIGIIGTVLGLIFGAIKAASEIIKFF